MYALYVAHKLLDTSDQMIWTSKLKSWPHPDLYLLVRNYVKRSWQQLNFAWCELRIPSKGSRSCSTHVCISSHPVHYSYPFLYFDRKVGCRRWDLASSQSLRTNTGITSSLFWDFTRRSLVVIYRRFATTYLSGLTLEGVIR